MMNILDNRGGYLRSVDFLPSPSRLYPFDLPAVRCQHSLSLHPNVTFLVGENGSGKSTLLEAIAIKYGFNAEGGSKNFRFSTRASHSELNRYIKLVKSTKHAIDGFFFRAESWYNVSSEIERLDEGPGGPPIIDSYGAKSLHEQSHGESFFSLMMHRFRQKSLFVLDEPEAALSPQRQLAMLRRIDELAREDCQFIIATHSPILMSYPHAVLYECSNDGIHPKRYQETEHFLTMKDFFAFPDRMLRVLLS